MIKKIYELRIFHYLVAGIIGFSVNIGALYLLTDYLKVWYLASSILAYTIAFSVSFVLQKFWTFKVSSFENLKKEITIYFIVFILGNLVNTALIYLFVEYIKLHYIVGAVLSNILIAAINFFLYKNIVFKNNLTYSNQ